MKKLSLFFFALAFLISFSVSAQVAKKILIEEFTNASCPPQNPILQEYIIDANPTTVIALKYQTQFPGTDPMNAQYPAGASVRAAYYPVEGVPQMWMNGVLPTADFAGGNGGWGPGLYNGAPAGCSQQVIDYLANETTPISMTLTHTISSDQSSIEITCTVTNQSSTDFSLTQGKLHVALTEKEISFDAPPGSNAETEFHNVCRAMYPDTGGSELETLAPGESETFTFTETLPTYLYDLSEVEVVAFVQDNSDKTVYQSVLSSAMTVNTETVNLLDGKVNVFPNPATTVANIEFELVEASNVDIKVYDVTGKLVEVPDNGTPYAAGKFVKTWNANTQAGVYLVKITTNTGELTQRINVIK